MEKTKAQKVLFIEDEPDQRAVMRIRLEEEGYEALFACNGEDGLDKAQQERPDLIILDIHLPKIDGWEVCRRLQKNPRTSRIPVVIATADGSPELEQKSSWMGTYGSFRKPFDVKTLLARMREILRK